MGNVAKTPPFASDPSSSLGPHVGDFAIKPEITAPGASIVAASGQLLGAQLVGHRDTAVVKRVNIYATALHHAIYRRRRR